MPEYQAFNKKTNRWVKYEFTKNGWRVKDVKQKNPTEKFKNVPVRGQNKPRNKK